MFSHLLSLSLAGVTTFSAFAVAEYGALLRSREYEHGELGRYPNVTYESFEALMPRWNIAKWDNRCDSNDLVFLTPHGDKVVCSLIIADQQGHMVWQKYTTEGSNHLHVVNFKGEPYLAYWEGNETKGVGLGSYHMLNQSYDEVFHIEAKKGLTGDLHGFSITSDDTALFTAYAPVPWDLTTYGRDDGYIWDGVFQEVDVETGELIFEWRASEHFAFTDMGTETYKNDIGTKKLPWDWFHINSVEKDPKGNFLISARYNNAATYINGTTGSIIWQLGGVNNSFTDPSGGAHTFNFNCNHDARFTNNYTQVTLFDNHAFWGISDVPARGLKFDINTDDMTAKLAAELIHPDGIISESQGSHQVLANGNSLVGYGHASVFAEYSEQGELLCDTHYAPVLTKNGTFDKSGWAQSYRVYKQRWVGMPRVPPSVKLASTAMHVSWNGATEVHDWRLEGQDVSDAGQWHLISTHRKTGFETTLGIGRISVDRYRLSAIDKAGNIFATFSVALDNVVTRVENEVADLLAESKMHDQPTSGPDTTIPFYGKILSGNHAKARLGTITPLIVGVVALIIVVAMLRQRSQAIIGGYQSLSARFQEMREARASILDT